MSTYFPARNLSLCNRKLLGDRNIVTKIRMRLIHYEKNNDNLSP